MPRDGSSQQRRDFFSAPFFAGLSSEEQIRALAEQIRCLPTGEPQTCIADGCEELVKHGVRCDEHRKAKFAAAARARYAKYGRRKSDPDDAR